MHSHLPCIRIINNLITIISNTAILVLVCISPRSTLGWAPSATPGSSEHGGRSSVALDAYGSIINIPPRAFVVGDFIPYRPCAVSQSCTNSGQAVVSITTIISIITMYWLPEIQVGSCWNMPYPFTRLLRGFNIRTNLFIVWQLAKKVYLVDILPKRGALYYTT